MSLWITLPGLPRQAGAASYRGDLQPSMAGDKNRLMVVGLTQAARQQHLSSSYPGPHRSIGVPSGAAHTLQQIVDLMFVFWIGQPLRQGLTVAPSSLPSFPTSARPSSTQTWNKFTNCSQARAQTLNVNTSPSAWSSLSRVTSSLSVHYSARSSNACRPFASRGQGHRGLVAEHQEPVIINNTYSDQRFSPASTGVQVSARHR